jgi:YHS domain-containing protein
MPAWIYLLIFAAFFFLMMRGGCGGHVAGHRHNREHAGRGTGRSSSPDKATDPVCGMTVETKTAKSAVHEGSVYYFCSPQCRDEFEASPASFAHGATALSQQMEHHHG